MSSFGDREVHIVFEVEVAEKLARLGIVGTAALVKQTSTESLVLDAAFPKQVRFTEERAGVSSARTAHPIHQGDAPCLFLLSSLTEN